MVSWKFGKENWNQSDQNFKRKPRFDNRISQSYNAVSIFWFVMLEAGY